MRIAYIVLREDFLSFLLKMTIPFAAYATAKNRPFSQKLSGSAVFVSIQYERTPPNKELY